MNDFEYILIPTNRTETMVDGDGNKIEVMLTDVMVKSEAILSKLPSSLYPGSWAWTAGMKKLWHKDFDGSWVSARE